MKNISKKIDILIEEYSLLKHPFYTAWTAGKLSKDMLRGYAVEYFELVKAVPQMMQPMVDNSPKRLRQEMIDNQQEENDHIPLWRRFAKALNLSDKDIDENKVHPKTKSAVKELAQLCHEPERGAVAMYALEKELPKISQTKLDGLKEFYGMDSEDAKIYFEEHCEADIRHAALWRNIIENSPLPEEEALETARASLQAQNQILDSCFENYCAELTQAA